MSRQIPWALRLFALFSILVTALDFGLLVIGPRNWREAILPLAGWVPSAPYVMSLYFALMLGSGRSRNRSFRFAIVAILALGVAFGLVIVALALASGPEQTNPYLGGDPAIAVWVCLIPTLWILVLSSPRVRSYCDD